MAIVAEQITIKAAQAHFIVTLRAYIERQAIATTAVVVGFEAMGHWTVDSWLLRDLETTGATGQVWGSEFPKSHCPL